jgi:hypothetical protein
MPKLNARENTQKRKRTKMRESNRALRATLQAPAAGGKKTTTKTSRSAAGVPAK